MSEELFELTKNHTLPVALSLLPAKFDTPQARAMLLAIAGQETDFKHRVQVSGPARGLWQFEPNTVRLVLAHPVVGPMAADAASRLRYTAAPVANYYAVADNDALACVFARLLLWPDPHPLPGEHDADAGWECYRRVWKPGKPRPDAWAANWRRAWQG